MNTILVWLIGLVMRFFLWFRYRVHIKGLERLTPENLNKPGGVIFMPNHAAVFVDPAMIVLALKDKFPIRPLVVDYMYKTPVAHTILTSLNAIPIPDFDFASNVLKKKLSDEAIDKLIEAVKCGDNFLIYPAARTKSQAKEIIGGSSGMFNILQKSPETNLVLVRISGLWGSSFSRYYTGYAPPLIGTALEGLKTIFKNFIFFTPKRDVYITFEPAPKDFPFQGSKEEINKYMENWYNQPDGLTEQEGDYPGDSVVRVSYSAFRDEFKERIEQESPLEEKIDVDKVSEKVKNKVYKEIAELSGRDPSTIKPELHIHQDLGLDSLDTAELAAYVHEEFKVAVPPVMALETVKIILGVASKQITLEVEENEAQADLKVWNKPTQHFRVQIAQGLTIPEVFLNNCERMGNAPAVVDRTSGVVTYTTLKLRVLVLADYIRNLPGEYIGIMLPASVAAYATILAVQLAGKTPLMVNWTIGRKHLESVVKISNVKVVLCSWKFLDRLGNVDLGGIEDKMVLLEDVRDEIGLLSKLKALYLSKKSTKKILETLELNTLKKDDAAVLLFTSGTESLPKGVPLTHHNLLSNQRGVLDVIPLYSDDVILGILPPFHSFGFSVSGLLGLLAGMRIGFSPNPTDGPKVARDFEEWGVTIMIGAPTFIKSLLTSATAEQLKTMRMCVTGAEAAPPELLHELAAVGKGQCICEGYGVTECSPILSANRPGIGAKGVGQAIKGVEILVVNEETYEPLPVGERGLIIGCGPNVFSGYLNPSLESPFIEMQGKRWYKTGDLGSLDEYGRLTISGRQKRFIKLGGEMLSLQALESAIHQESEKNNWKGDTEGASVAVCAKEIPGEKTKLYLFTTFEIDTEIANNALKDVGFSNLVKFTDVIQLEEIPIMGTGKIYYRLLEEQL